MRTANINIKEALSNLDLVYTTIGNIGNTGLGAVLWFLLASILNVSNYGNINYFIAVAAIASTFGILGLNLTVTTYLAKGYKNIVYESNSMITFTSIFLFMVLTFVYGWETAFIAISLMYYTMSVAYLLGKKRYKEYSLVLIGERLCQIIFSIILYFHIGITGILLGYALGPLILSYRFISTIKNIRIKFNILKEKSIFALHSYGLSVINSLSIYLDKVIIGMLFGFYILGIYQLAYQFLLATTIIPGSLFAYLLPKESSGVSERAVKLLGLLISILVIIAIFIGGPIIIPILFPRYVDSIAVIDIMIFSLLPLTITSISNSKLLGNEESGVALRGSLIYLATLLPTLILLGMMLNIAGLALSIVVANTLRAIYLIYKAGL